jgi:glycosyltransferase involved in cell wall biosynthesis
MSKRKIGIVHLITTLEVGGTEKMLMKLLSFMDSEKFANEVVSLRDIGPVGREIINMGIPVFALSMPRGRPTVCALVNLLNYLHLKRPAILQTWLYHADFLGLITGKMARVKNICWNIRCSYMDIDKYSIISKWIIRLCSLLSRFPKVVLTNSYEAKKYHMELGYRAKRWKIIPNGFDLDKFKPDELAKSRLISELDLEKYIFESDLKDVGPEEGRRDIILIGFIARHDPMKDHSTFIRAGCILLKENIDVYFVFAGKGIDVGKKSIVTQIPERFRSHFHLLGERDDMENITAGLDIASSVSLGEGFSNTVGEAMACAVPCVVTDVGDSARIVGDTGRVVPPKDPQALANAWKGLIDIGQEGRHSLGLLARKRIKEHFEISKVVKQYEELYTSLVANG